MGYIKVLILVFVMLLGCLNLNAQDVLSQKEQAPTQLKKAADNLEKSLKENDNPRIANDYELLAQEFADKDEPAKAETQLFKALGIYTVAKDRVAMARVIRDIARVQERQGKMRAAAQNYKAAAETTFSKADKSLNNNDYSRLKNLDDYSAEKTYLDANIRLLKTKKNNVEVADTYMQLAVLNLKNADTTAALEHYKKALPYAKNIAAKTIKIYSESAKLYVAAKQNEEAVATLKKLLKYAEKDNLTRIAQLKYLAAVYFEMDEPENAIDALQESYKIASAAGETFEARESLGLMADHYKTVGDTAAVMISYEEFLKNLDRIILSDSSLTDAKTFRVTEERIRGLESEKKLKDELIDRQNTFTYLLIGFMVLLLLLFGFIIKALYSIKAKNKEIALQSLRREMNPHFLFNSLNSVNQFIAQNNELAANKYLTSYSNLMRNTMENSNKDFVTLANEVENLTQYLELEHLRFKDKFDFKIVVGEQLDPENVKIPNMVIQPHLENAIWHGLRYKEGKGVLKLEFLPVGKNIIVTIDDNGIGPTQSAELKTHNQKAHESRGLTNTKERMTLLNELYKTKMDFTITEKQSPQTGTIIKITLPIITKPL